MRRDEEEQARLRALDLPMRPLRWAEIVEERERPRRAAWRPVAAVAAVLVLVAALGWAGPMRELLQSAIASLKGSSGHEAPSIVPSAPDDSAGVRVALEGSRFFVTFVSVVPGGSARVVISPGDQLEVRTSDPRVTFTSEARGLRIDAHGRTAGFLILVPAQASGLEFQVAGHTVFRKTTAGITLAEPQNDGSWRIPLDER